MKRSEVGIFQEELPSGKIAASSMRIMSFIALISAFLYAAISYLSYESHFDKFVLMRTNGVISEQSFNALVGELKMFEEWVLLILLAAAFAPKAFQKVIEMRAGVKTKE